MTHLQPLRTPAQSLMDLEQRHGAQNYHPLPVMLAEGEGTLLRDVEGRDYLDFIGAYSSVSHGHRHPRIVAAAMAQLERVAVTSRAVHAEPLGPFLKLLTQVTGLERALVMNTGAEAVETAIKAARRHAHQHRGIPDGMAEILVAEGNFHGRTTTIVGFSSESEYRRGFGPFTPGFRQVPFGDAAAMRAAVTPHSAAILIEPIQGEAGIILPPSGYLQALRALCDETGVLLILDEIQSGLGRTGRMFAFEHEGIRPDGLILGKALGGGLLPVSAFLSSAAVMSVFTPGSHGSTFGGSPLAAAVGLAALQVLLEESLPERSDRLGALLLAELSRLQHPAIQAVRGRGLWVAMDLDPALIGGREFCERLMTAGLLAKDTHGQTIRFAPPLTVSEAEIHQAVAIVRATLAGI